MELTIYFDGQYWRGMVEDTDDFGRLKVYPYVFGKEPNSQDIESFICHVLPDLLNVPWQGETLSEKKVKRVSPKRMQQMIQKEKRKPVLSTKAQLALTEQREAVKREQQHQNKRKRQDEKQLSFEKKQLKRLEKRRGH